jgi:hypothetical protein
MASGYHLYSLFEGSVADGPRGVLNRIVWFGCVIRAFRAKCELENGTQASESSPPQRRRARLQVKESLLIDVSIGLSLTFMVVPQGMSYAILAGLPSVYGLYGAVMPVLMYTLLGTSRHLAVGPTAVSSLLTGSVLRRVYPMAKQISDPNNPPPGLELVQQKMNTAAVQVCESGLFDSG